MTGRQAGELTGYELRNLAAHLEEAGQEDILHRLLALETDAGTNYWFEAKDDSDPGGYVADAERALRLARRTVDRRLGVREPAPEVAVEIRYALLIASVRSAVGGVPTSLLTAMIDNGVRSAEGILADISQVDGGPPDSKVVASLVPHLPEPVRHNLLRDVLLAAGSLDDSGRRDTATTLSPHLPPHLMSEALHLTGDIEDESDRVAAVAALASHLPPHLRDEAVALAAKFQHPLLRTAALATLGILPSRESLQAALTEDAETYWGDRLDGTLLLAKTLPPELLDELLAVARTFGANTGTVLEALAPRLPDQLLRDAVTIAQQIGRFHRPGAALAALAPRLSGVVLRRARRGLRHIQEPEDRIRALNELAQRHPPDDRHWILRSALRVAEEANFGSPDLKNATIRLIELLPQQLVPRALALARTIDPNKGGAAVLAAVGARLTGPEREAVLREALQATRRIDDDEEWRMLPDMTSAKVLAQLAPLLPGEVLPFVLDDIRPHDNWDWSANRLAAVIPHLQADELRVALRAAREQSDGKAQVAAVAGLVDHVREPDRTQLLRASLHTCGRIRQNWDRVTALRALGPKLSEDLGAEALDIARSMQYETGALARAAVAGSVPLELLSTALDSVIPGYEYAAAVTFAALAAKAEEPTRTGLLRRAMAVVGRSDWDDRIALDADFIAQLAPSLPEHLLDEAVDTVLTREQSALSCSYALSALARRFDGARKAELLQKALAFAQEMHNYTDAIRVGALIKVGPDVPGVIDAVQQIDDWKWRALALAGLGKPIPEEATTAPLGSLNDLDNVSATLQLLLFMPLDQAQTVLREMRESDGWTRLVDGEWFPTALGAVLPRLDPRLVPDLLAMAREIPASGRPPLLAALINAFPTLPQHHLHECWRLARAALDAFRRTQVLEAIAVLAPVIHAVGGQTSTRDTAASIHLMGRWHP